VSKTILLLVL